MSVAGSSRQWRAVKGQDVRQEQLLPASCQFASFPVLPGLPACRLASFPVSNNATEHSAKLQQLSTLSLFKCAFRFGQKFC